MIQLTGNPSQFKTASERARKERMLVSLISFRTYSVLNRRKGTRYTVFFSIINGKRFGVCNCAAGTPCNGRRVPRECKHLFAATLVHTSLMRQRQTSH